MAEIDFVALVRSELQKMGLDPNLFALPPNLLVQTTAEHKAKDARTRQQIDDATRAAGAAFPPYGPVVAEIGIFLSHAYESWDPFNLDSEQNDRNRALFAQKGNADAHAYFRAVVDVETGYFKVLEDGITVIQQVENSLGLTVRTRDNVLGSLALRDPLLLPTRKSCVVSYETKEKIPLCRKGFPGVPNFLGMDRNQATIDGIKIWPEAFAYDLAEEAAQVVAVGAMKPPKPGLATGAALRLGGLRIRKRLSKNLRGLRRTKSSGRGAMVGVAALAALAFALSA